MITSSGQAYLTKQAAFGMPLRKNLWNSGSKAVGNAYGSMRTSIAQQGGLRNAMGNAYGQAKNYAQNAYTNIRQNMPTGQQMWNTVKNNKGTIAAGAVGLGLGASMGNKTYNTWNYTQPNGLNMGQAPYINQG